MSIVLNQIIITAIYEKEMCKNKLEVEESGRLVAALQGNVSGYKNLLGYITESFHMAPVWVEDTGDKPMVFQDLEDGDFEVFKENALHLRETAEWKEVLGKIDNDIECLKSKLLFDAEKTRDLDICQGRYKAQTFFNAYFRSIEQEYDRRQRNKKDEKENPSLPFDGEGNEEDDNTDVDLHDDPDSSDNFPIPEELEPATEPLGVEAV